MGRDELKDGLMAVEVLGFAEAVCECLMFASEQVHAIGNRKRINSWIWKILQDHMCVCGC